MLEDDASFILVSWAKQFIVLLLEICRGRNRRKLARDALKKASDIAARLQMVCPYIQSLPRYWIGDEIDQLCRRMLKQMTIICMSPSQVRIPPGAIVATSSALLAGQSPHDMKRSIFESFLENGQALDDFYQDCYLLYETLAPNNTDIPALPPNSKSLMQPDFSEYNHALFDALQKHCVCVPGIHKVLHSSDLIWHPARLCLEGNSKSAAAAAFGIFVSSMDMAHWQELRLDVPSDAENTVSDDILAPGEFCTVLEEQPGSRLLFEFKPGFGLCQLPRSGKPHLVPEAGQGESLANVLRQYRLTPRDRVILSCAIARAYWQFYDSELMWTKWSSETIWFMPAINRGDQLPLRVFISVPFDSPNESAEDFIQDSGTLLYHRCPRIFALGILLLEIGLGKPFPTRVCKTPAFQVNHDHPTATYLLETLRKTKWNGFSHIRYYIDAVEYCIDSGNFVKDPAEQQQQQQTSTARRPREPLSEQAKLAKRRKALYSRVVLPLTWLSTKGFEGDSEEVTYLDRAPVPQAPEVPPQPPSQVDVGRDGGAVFHSGQTLSTKNWLGNLKFISAYVDKQRDAHASDARPIRVAILDTGISMSMPFFFDEDYGVDRQGQVKYFKDFVIEDDSSGGTDSCEHGSLMSRLVAEVTPFESKPFVEIMVARVARDTKDLPRSTDRVAEAILWAGESGADIISMSFGLPRDHQKISQAIHKVSSREAGAIFLASAGNSPFEVEAFPARHPGVTAIYATNRYGNFVESNAQRPADGSRILGVFGDGIPPDIYTEFEREYRGICQPGSSVSTAVAAGIAALTLAYVDLLPKLLASNVTPSVAMLRALGRVRSADGMRAVFHAMAQHMSDGQWFVNPARFWKDMSTDEARYHAISSTLYEVDRRL